MKPPQYEMDDLMTAEALRLRDGILIWPLIRLQVFNRLFKKEGEQKAHATVRQPLLSVGKLRYYYHSWRHSPLRKAQPSPVVFHASARGRLSNPDFNVYTDYYAGLIEDSFVMESPFGERFIIPSNNERYAAIRHRGFLRLEITWPRAKSALRRDYPDIARFGDILAEKYSMPQGSIETLQKSLYYYSFRQHTDFYRKVLERLKPKVLFVHTGSDGGHYSLLIRTAHEMGIPTAELQHGTISREYWAYNFGEKCRSDKETAEHLPHYVLTYGDYWNTLMNTPAKVITIGNPHFYKSIKKYGSVKPEEKTVLIVSQGTLTGKMTAIAMELAEKMKDYRIIYKLHPGEVPFKERYSSLYRYNNIEVADKGDIYEYIARAEYIVGCYSTTLFEAMGFRKRIFILDNEFSRASIPDDVGLRFSSATELVELIESTGMDDMHYNPEYYFSSDWKENYIKFLEDVAGIRV